MLAESEPVPGSVIAMAAHVPAKRCCCSSSATEAMAELPSPCRGIESSRPTSPQHISAIDITDEQVGAVAHTDLLVRRLVTSYAGCPAPSAAPDSGIPSIIAASMSSCSG